MTDGEATDFFAKFAGHMEIPIAEKGPGRHRAVQGERDGARSEPG